MARLRGQQMALDTFVSNANSNLMQSNGSGLYMALQAAPNVAVQYVSSSTGSDSNIGSRASPLKTIGYALSRIPANTSATILLNENDTFPWQAPGDPTAWGSTIGYFGRVMGTGTVTVVFAGYGSDTDAWNAKASGTIGFAGWQVAASKRPKIEIGHYIYNGKPVFTGLSIGGPGGQLATFQGIEFTVTAAARSIAVSNNGMTTQGYNQLFVINNGSFLGCIMPAPIVANNNTVVYTLGTYQRTTFWQVSIPVEASNWLLIGATSLLDFLDSGSTTTDNTGTANPTLSNSVATNLSTRTAGVIKDTNGTVRNVRSNIPL